jgi:hypothetical protein
VAAIVAIFGITLFADIPSNILAGSYVVGIVVLVLSFEVYIFFSYISDRFKNRFITYLCASMEHPAVIKRLFM